MGLPGRGSADRITDLGVAAGEVTSRGPSAPHRLGVPKNDMFIGTPGDRFPHKLAELGGVRLIL